jgi:hypothetical protein
MMSVQTSPFELDIELLLWMGWAIAISQDYLAQKKNLQILNDDDRHHH